MYKAKFIGGYMDGEWLVLRNVPPRYHFPRFRDLSTSMLLDTGLPSRPIKFETEDYELDSWEGDRVFYRRVGLPPQ